MKQSLAILVLSLLLFFPSCNKEEAQLSYKAQLQKDDEAIDQYLEGHRITAVQDTSGIRYVITSLGTGAKPSPSGYVTLGVEGKFLNNNQIFALDTLLQILPFNTLIVGLQKALVLMP